MLILKSESCVTVLRNQDLIHLSPYRVLHFIATRATFLGALIHLFGWLRFILCKLWALKRDVVFQGPYKKLLACVWRPGPKIINYFCAAMLTRITYSHHISHKNLEKNSEKQPHDRPFQTPFKYNNGTKTESVPAGQHCLSEILCVGGFWDLGFIAHRRPIGPGFIFAYTWGAE